MKNNETLKAIIRLIITVIILLNAFLASKGIAPIPFDETAFAEGAFYVLSGLATVWIWWKNNNVTKASHKAQDYLRALKEDGEEEEDSDAENEA